MRLAALSSGPMMVTNGLATVWSIASAVPIVNRASKNRPYVLVNAVGQKSKAPKARISNPMTPPFFNPVRFNSNAAGIVMTRYAM